MATIRLENIVKRFDNGLVAVHNTDLSVNDGEFLVLVGPSGCGKSTTLRMIAGLEEPTDGRILIGDRCVNGLPPGSRDIAMVFQNYALYPHMTVRQNLSFGLRMQRTPRAEIDRRVRQAAQILSIEPLLDRRPRQLSGGQRQRVAVGRAIVRQPAAFLFDEPLSNLDARLRVQMRKELAQLHNRLGTTTVYVTHDQVEAMTLGERIVVMNEGRIQQVARPLELYDRPANQFVAGFIGNPAMNLVPGRIVSNGDSTGFCCEDVRYPVDTPPGLKSDGPKSDLSDPVVLGFRPEHLTLESGDPLLAEVSVEVVERLGGETMVYFRLSGTECVAKITGPVACQRGDRLALHLPGDRWYLFSGDDGGRCLAAGRPDPESQKSDSTP